MPVGASADAARRRQWESERRRPRRGLALAALAAGVLGVGIAAAASGGSSPQHSRTAASVGHTLARRSNGSVQGRARTARKPGSHSASATVDAKPAAATTPPPTADTLEAKGHALLLAGNYAAAIPVLRQAVSAASPDSLTYGYALFDLGRSLRLSGDPRSAVPILWQRLQIPNQTDVVRAELQLALRALGRQAAQSGGGSPVPGKPGPGGGHHGHDQGGGAPPGQGQSD
jgi:Flp pilus assembly protein TadD